jgi:FMN phosphatase YigB (HAD superfamily)
MATPYRVILFDCVNTLYLPEASRLPTLEVDGERVVSTAGLLHRCLLPHLPHLEPAQVHHAARASMRWAEAQRGPTLQEVPAATRFQHLLGVLGLAQPSEALLQQALAIHYEAVTGSFALPSKHSRLLERLQPRYRLALLSNFDHGPALLRLLREGGIDRWLDPILISDGLGFRKPGAAAFSRALERVGEEPRHILLVGDSSEDDVRGGREAGLDVAWINRKGLPLPEGIPRPTYELGALPDLERLLRGES